MNKKLKNIPFQFKNEVVNNKTVLTLSGVVGKPYPWEDETDTINEKLIENALSGVDGDINIRLNSPGGDVFEGISICNLLKSLDNHVTIEVTALAASAASIIAMGADKVIMDQGSSMMVHEASTMAWGNKQDIQKTLNALETIDKSLISIYQTKTGLDEKTISDFLTAETWLTAQEAVENGFADEVGNVDIEDEIEPEPEKVVDTEDEKGTKANGGLIGLDGITLVSNEIIAEVAAKVQEKLEDQLKEKKQEEPKPQKNLLKNFLGGIN
ncbi:head maturation protease, ClpP-related [Facklamia miroungae]|uniref:ATP-dependent Clp protease proteolytic subunit n=1 Tax=Facklamia miroungae TaxID=120956 RepID=A0A1G7NZK6_9LACT|nr:head maturation protease, ClpP-related [Facklamia miroungae]NKZ28529.1 Clp protease ClpP [Facklamia miroungae]SDF79482.1 ATP-dependent protease ClpP, protease subunit [Facklamia miroungae]